ncbi:THAP domain-containing protein 2-like [Xenia sp. Carnegie-2017]|uniref:THAP domain-containing protein 2-like n=1 Tax=Xenia sp. Carnegie-2017 TaxID=2897299 RepID=UPI001F04833E|nr:THAP domain-containing protein 2-like [Xenia sp. Carnegie-2017]
MPDRCAVFGCSKRANYAEGISLHRIPFYGDERPEAKRRRKIWVNFVARKRARWTPTKYSAVCSVHFTDADYEKYMVEIPGTKNYTPRLKKDDFGITAYPTIFLKDDEPKNPTPREK